eukprot:TRINITY_DN17034_c0_g1_i1.p1 TRINITY_DN17034_c0_g1~~TRINITY_DN17034_c0_g1_i1.p1  ORF type:complete len:525 (+),score=166.17 TRINITY_DN17034_c0_g1_i1:51-1625(+)
MEDDGATTTAEGQRVMLYGMPSSGAHLNGQMRISCPAKTRTSVHGTYRLVQSSSTEKGVYINEKNLVDVQRVRIARPDASEKLMVSFLKGTTYVKYAAPAGLGYQAGIRVGMTVVAADGVRLADLASFFKATEGKAAFDLDVIATPPSLVPQAEPANAAAASVTNLLWWGFVAWLLISTALIYGYRSWWLEDVGGARGRQHRGSAPPAEPAAYPERPDYYALLGLEKGAAAKDIKKAFRKLATSRHPDSSSDRTEYERIREAYDVLQDARSRKVYDLYGLNAEKDAKFVPDEQAQARGWRLQVYLEQVYTGTESSVSFNKKVLADRGQVAGCLLCLQRPPEAQLVQWGGMVMQQMVQPDCRGACNVDRRSVATALPIEVPPGVAHGETITVAYGGDEHAHVLPGDVQVQVQVYEHGQFRRVGNDLRMTLTVTLPEALRGFRYRATHLDQREFFIESEGVTPHGTVITLEGEGMPHRNDPGRKGDLYVDVHVKFPTAEFSEEKADKFRALFEEMGMGEGWRPGDD